MLSAEEGKEEEHHFRVSRAADIVSFGTVNTGHLDEDEQENELHKTVWDFFVLGLQLGIVLCMFIISLVMVTATEGSSSMLELSGLYYPIFRGLVILSFCFCCYGMLLFVWMRHGINYEPILNVDHAQHNYHYIVRSAFTIVSVSFFTFVGCNPLRGTRTQRLRTETRRLPIPTEPAPLV